jgi:hypothetical protein
MRLHLHATHVALHSRRHDADVEFYGSRGGDHAHQPHQTSVAEQVRANLALLEVAQEDTVHTPRQQP